MAFRKRNVAIGRSPASPAPDTVGVDDRILGLRPSPLSSHSVTSTGTPSLDGLLGGHGGLALGSSLLIEESGTTDYAGVLLRYYAAEGICQGHVLHVVGVGEGWVRELPGIAEEKSRGSSSKDALESAKMKIAWRYEKLGQAGERALPDRGNPTLSPTSQAAVEPTFCHTFDLTKRLSIPAEARINYIPIHAVSTFDDILTRLARSLSSVPTNNCHRLVIPSLLSPALYPPESSKPENLITFMRSLRCLLRQHSARLTALMTLPLDLHPRSTGLVRWAETLCDGVVQLTPFPHTTGDVATADKDAEGTPQGMLKIHKLPIITERGEGGAGAGNSLSEDLAFTVSRRKFVIKSFSLPPVEGDQEAQNEAGQVTGKDVEF